MRVIGLMSGTSVDGVDAALVDIFGSTTDLEVNLIASRTFAYELKLRQHILDVCAGAALSMAELAELDQAIALTFAEAANRLQTEHGAVDLIGSHGQTVYHAPPPVQPFNSNSPTLGHTIQLGRGSVIAAQSKCPTVSNFRVADMAMGGHGAPLVPPVDRCILGHPTLNRCVQNIGGIGNVTDLPALNRRESIVRGWDTGPGNALLDLAVEHLSQGTLAYDQDGAWAAQGTVDHDLVNQWLNHPFFHTSPPKSTGRELFGKDYVQMCLADARSRHLKAADTLATIAELTVGSIEQSYRNFLSSLPDQVLICGGGSRNLYLMERLRSRLHPIPVLTTDEVGLNADVKEAIAFGVLAYWRWRAIPGNLPMVTGASHAVPLGEIHLPPQLDKDQMKLLMENKRLAQYC